MISGLPRHLAVVAHDAGAANHIFSWLHDERPSLCLAGPAKALWQARLKKNHHQSNSEPSGADDFLCTDIETALAGVTTVITGTGWESSLEHEARRVARKLGIRSIAVIDHWTNYVDRFVRNGEQVLPDEIWVSDIYAETIAKTTFPTVRVIQQVNAYLASLVKEVESLQSKEAANGNDRVLYVLEPIRNAWGNLVDPGEFLALDYFIEHHKLAHVSENAEIRLRPHPSDPPGKYDAWLSRHTNYRVSLDNSCSLADALAWSNVVVGCQTYAMVLALACGRTVISTIPAWAPTCVLPHTGIIKLADRVRGPSF